MGSIVRRRLWKWLGVVLGIAVIGACSPAGVVIGVAAAATDNSVSWDIVKHLHGKLTEGDPVPCASLNSVQRALNLRCGGFVPGSLRAADIRDSKLQQCPLAAVVRDPRFWPALPEFLDKGAQPEACARSPLADLAALEPCPDFAAAPREVVASLRWLAEADSRAVTHDVVRMLSCPSARAAGLDTVIDRWLAQGELDPAQLGFGALGALDPSALATPLAAALEARGHTARAGLGGFDGAQPGGFEEALRTSQWAALDWWLARVPELANRVAPTRERQLSWQPLARVLVPTFLADPRSQRDMVRYLLAHGADPSQRLPFDPGRSVLDYARRLHSPWVGLLEAPAGTTVLARTGPP